VLLVHEVGGKPGQGGILQGSRSGTGQRHVCTGPPAVLGRVIDLLAPRSPRPRLQLCAFSPLLNCWSPATSRWLSPCRRPSSATMSDTSGWQAGDCACSSVSSYGRSCRDGKRDQRQRQWRGVSECVSVSASHAPGGTPFLQACSQHADAHAHTTRSCTSAAEAMRAHSCTTSSMSASLGRRQGSPRSICFCVLTSRKPSSSAHAPSHDTCGRQQEAHADVQNQKSQQSKSSICSLFGDVSDSTRLVC
jgi:hypothetical protein